MKQYIIYLGVLISIVFAHAEEFHVLKSSDNLVKFISDAPIEDFEGVTDKIDGYLYWEGEDLLKNSELYFEVDLNTVDTGIGLRNRHMRDNYLETEKYPTTHFKGKMVKAEKVGENEYKVQVRGKMFIHGKENDLTVEGSLKRDGDVLQVSAGFEVKLSDYAIKVPSIMFYKIDETMTLELNFKLKVHKEQN